MPRDSCILRSCNGDAFFASHESRDQQPDVLLSADKMKEMTGSDRRMVVRQGFFLITYCVFKLVFFQH